jgi:hypothetical protein
VDVRGRRHLAGGAVGRRIYAIGQNSSFVDHGQTPHLFVAEPEIGITPRARALTDARFSSVVLGIERLRACGASAR